MRILSGIQRRTLGLESYIALLVIASSVFTGCAPQESRKSSKDNADYAALVEEMQTPEYRMKKERQTPLHIAAADGKTNEVIRLLKKGAEVDPRDRWNRTPLHLAAEWGHVGIVKELLASGADVNAQTRLSETPLYFALRYWQSDEDTATGKAHWNALVNMLLDAGARINLVNSTRLTPLQLAAGARNGNGEIVQRLIKAGASVNIAEEYGDTALHFAANSGKTENVKQLLEAGANVNARGRGDCTPLHCATWHSETSAALVRVLLDASADINARDHNGQTPLHKAAEAGRADIIALLLDAKADINSTDDEGRTALDIAVQPRPLVSQRNTQTCVALLKERGGRNGSGQADR